MLTKTMQLGPKKKKPKSKGKQVTKLKKELMALVKALIKIRDDFTCQKCGAKVSGSNCHASHVIPVSAGNALAFDPINLKTLCLHCHMNWWHKNPLEASAWFEKKFPERAKYLNAHKGDVVHWKAEDYQRMIDELEDHPEKVTSYRI